MSRLTPNQLLAVSRISIAVLETVEEAGEAGAPAGPLFAAMQAQGATLNKFSSLMSIMVGPGYLVLENDCYFSTAGTAAFKAKLQRIVDAISN